jgi:hypothetical protein
MFIHVHDRVSAPRGDRHRHDLLLEAPVPLCGDSPAVRIDCELVLRLTTDRELATEVLRRLDHAALDRVVLATGGDAATGDTVPHLDRVPAISETPAKGVVLGLAHALGTACDDHVAGTGLHTHRCVQYRLQCRATPAVELLTRDGDRETGVQRCHAADGRRLTVGVALTEDDVVDRSRVYPGALHKATQDRGRQPGCGNILESAAVLAHGGPQWLADHCFTHVSLVSLEGVPM